jgi:hypothetical protein
MIYMGDIHFGDKGQLVVNRTMRANAFYYAVLCQKL